MAYIDHCFALVLAGGGGTRLWPKSRNKTPKQFLKLVDDKTMIQLCAQRINKIIPWEKIIVITNQLYKDEIKKQLPELPLQNIVAEPEKRDTALAMLVGALFAKSKDPEAVVLNCASDHVVGSDTEFIKVMKAASQVAADQDYLVSVGITPTTPATGFGYIKIGQDLKKINNGLALFQVDSFTEKPNRPTAQAFISTGKYFWNANMYVWQAKKIQTAFERYMPALAKAAQTLESLNAKDFHAALPAIYKDAETISIDYAISEKADNLVLIPGDFGWNDVGDWKVVFDLGRQDSEGNVVISDSNQNHSLVIQSSGNLIHTNGRLVALVGVENMVVVDTEQILLIVPKNSSQDVKKLVEKLKAENKEEYL
ncbi:MAG: mannose-1-phosphate guanylyltransferase [Candidatus Pacebacteria bacterium CG_4_10_14_0_8_um_filter_43_12]|nr:MAG: mannose-1-phosphate guanylyltransferase [Candidatus Pacebacteria bacterium CG_4_10_14_0_8_um_filter_43_12]